MALSSVAASLSGGLLVKGYVITLSSGSVSFCDVSSTETPEISDDLYREIAGWGIAAPDWLQVVAAFLTEAFLVLLALLALLAWWRSRDRGISQLIAPFLGTGFAYLISNTVKELIQQDRPCRAVSAVRGTVEQCPEYGDWSLPSNHSTIAAALAVAIALLWRRFALPALAMALLAGFSRVLVGAHYPHDVLAGLALGALVSALVVAVIGRFGKSARGGRPAASDEPTAEIERV